MDQETFFSQFRFNTTLTGSIGTECEYFLTDANGMPVSSSPLFLERIADEAWTYELSACQVEHRTPPEKNIERILASITDARIRGHVLAKEMGLNFSALELAPEDMPLDIYPHDVRYQTIATTLPTDILRAACRVAGTHIHIGVSGIQEAISIHNKIVRRLERFMSIGDHSNGERLRLYRMMAKYWRPPIYESPTHFYETACVEGFEKSPRNCWHLVRISLHGTVELRMFGINGCVSEVGDWIRLIQETIQAM